MKKLFYVILFLSFSGYGQEVSGYLYDSEGRIEDFLIQNKTQHRQATSDRNGFFRIPARQGDTLVFSSIAYEPTQFEVRKEHLNEAIVVELKLNSLEEVIINSHKLEPRTVESLQKELDLQISNDIKNNPLAYQPSSGNILDLVSGILRLLKKEGQEKEKAPPVRKLQYHELKFLFEKDEVLNEQFLIEEIAIPKQHHPLFIEYLSSQNWNADLLEEDHRLYLIQALYEAGADFTQILEASKEEKE